MQLNFEPKENLQSTKEEKRQRLNGSKNAEKRCSQGGVFA